MSLLTRSHSLEASHGGSYRLLSQHLISNSNGCHLSCFDLQWMVFSGLKSRKKKTHVVLFYFARAASVLIHNRTAGWKTYARMFLTEIFFFFLIHRIVPITALWEVSLPYILNPLTERMGICRPSTYPDLGRSVINWLISCSHACSLRTWNFSELISVSTCQKMVASKMLPETLLFL